MRRDTRSIGVCHAANGGIWSRVQREPEAVLGELLVEIHKANSRLHDAIKVFLNRNNGGDSGKEEKSGEETRTSLILTILSKFSKLITTPPLTAAVWPSNDVPLP